MGKAGGGEVRAGEGHRLWEEGGPRRGIQGEKWETRSHVSGWLEGALFYGRREGRESRNLKEA